MCLLNTFDTFVVNESKKHADISFIKKRAHWESNPGLRTRNPMHYHYAIRPSHLILLSLSFILFFARDHSFSFLTPYLLFCLIYIIKIRTDFDELLELVVHISWDHVLNIDASIFSTLFLHGQLRQVFFFFFLGSQWILSPIFTLKPLT